MVHFIVIANNICIHVIDLNFILKITRQNITRTNSNEWDSISIFKREHPTTLDCLIGFLKVYPSLLIIDLDTVTVTLESLSAKSQLVLMPDFWKWIMYSTIIQYHIRLCSMIYFNNCDLWPLIVLWTWPWNLWPSCLVDLKLLFLSDSTN